MIKYSEHILENGLLVLVNHDPMSELAAVNILYKVGSRNENPGRTGFAHLFEHLMFRGTKAIPDYDVPIQEACGENNAFTTNDYTDYYITLPKDNIETAFWIESDRMTGLDITPEKLEAEKMVVIEEFNQRYLNQPYGDQWHILRDMVYKHHPYRWPTIGITPDHIRNATIEDVRSFYERYYQPSNAILSVSGDIEPRKVFELAEKWFGPLPSHSRPRDIIPEEIEQTGARRVEARRNVPATQVTIAFHMGPRYGRNYYICDVLSDILAGGASARLYQRLVKNRKVFSSVNAFITGDIDPGMFILTGHLMPGVSVEKAEEAFWTELDIIVHEGVGDQELEKIRNKFEAGITFGELNVMNKAMNLGYYAMWDNLPQMNEEIEMYRSVDVNQIKELIRRMFSRDKSSTMIIRPENEK